ncbi:hypothetical protein BGC_60700 [Burkholderia sp. 3C]
MLGHQHRLIAGNQRVQPGEMARIEQPGAADRHADAMHRQRMVAAYRTERAVRGAAVAHVVLGVHFEEQAFRPLLEYCGEMVVLEADAGKRGEFRHR